MSVKTKEPDCRKRLSHTPGVRAAADSEATAPKLAPMRHRASARRMTGSCSSIAGSSSVVR